MTEKIQYINANFTLHIKPISFYSKSFSPAQVTGYVTMEKEFLGLMLSVANFRDYMMSVPITYILTDSQPVCWAIVYAIDFFGRTRKISKNNIKMASQRTARLLAKLPDEIKLILGEEFTEKTWDDIKNSSVLPKYTPV
jgi:RNase H-like domain found in reverse transcriptase